MCHTGLGRGQAAEVQPSPCCLDDIIPHTFIFIHTLSPKTWTNTAVTNVLFRTETFESIEVLPIRSNWMFCAVWQDSCRAFVTLNIHTCLIITDTIAINQRIVTIITWLISHLLTLTWTAQLSHSGQCTARESSPDWVRNAPHRAQGAGPASRALSRSCFHFFLYPQNCLGFKHFSYLA